MKTVALLMHHGVHSLKLARLLINVALITQPPNSVMVFAKMLMIFAALMD